MSDITVDTTEIDRLNRNLKTYSELRYRMTEDEILNKVGNDVRIKLFKEFWARRWKPGGKKSVSALARKMASGGKGFKVRTNQLIAPWEGKIPTETRRGKPLNMRQKLVAQELMRRRAGAGLLGVAFLRRRWRYKKDRKYLARNFHTGKIGDAATFKKRVGSFEIEGLKEGLGKIASQYGIVNKALSAASANIEVYIGRKLGPDFLKTLHS